MIKYFKSILEILIELPVYIWILILIIYSLLVLIPIKTLINSNYSADKEAIKDLFSLFDRNR